MRTLIFTIIFLLLVGGGAFAGIFIYSNQQLPYWAFEKNIESLLDLKQVSRAEMQENIGLTVSSEAPLDIIDLNQSQSRNIIDIVIEPQDDKVVVSDSEGNSSEQSLADVKENLVFSERSSEYWENVSSNRLYQINETSGTWVYQINEEQSKQIFRSYFDRFAKDFESGLLENLAAENVEGIAFEALTPEIVVIPKLEIEIDKNTYNTKEIRITTEGNYSIGVKITIADNVLLNLPEEQKILQNSEIKVIFEDIEATYTFKSFERLEKFRLPSNNIQFWAEQVL